MRNGAIQKNHEMRLFVVRVFVWGVVLMAVVGLIQKML